jgi:hypothetical protein
MARGQMDNTQFVRAARVWVRQQPATYTGDVQNAGHQTHVMPTMVALLAPAIVQPPTVPSLAQHDMPVAHAPAKRTKCRLDPPQQ